MKKKSQAATRTTTAYKPAPAKSRDTLIISAVRYAFFRSATYREFMSKQPVRYVGKRRFHPCAHCNEFWPKSKLDLDHIAPVVDPAVGRTTWEEYFDRVWCEESNLQLLCKSCHKVKTRAEGKIRTVTRRRNSASITPQIEIPPTTPSP